MRSYPPVVAEGETYLDVADGKKARTHVARAFPSLAADLRPGALLLPLDDATRRPGRAGKTPCANVSSKPPYPRRAYHSSVLRVASRNVDGCGRTTTRTTTCWRKSSDANRSRCGRPLIVSRSCTARSSSSRVADIAAELDTDSRIPQDSTRDPRPVERRRRRDAPALVALRRRSKRGASATLRPGEALYIPATCGSTTRARRAKKKAAQKTETRGTARPWRPNDAPAEPARRGRHARRRLRNKDPPAAAGRAADMAAHGRHRWRPCGGRARGSTGARRAAKRLAERRGRWNCQRQWRRRSPGSGSADESALRHASSLEV